MSKSLSVAIPIRSGANVPALSVKQILPWLIFAGLLLLVGLYFLSTEQGAMSLLSGTAVHEWLHDGRHLLGFPCH
jgi:Probable cobalt transporter subunit (CbtB)